MIPILGDIKILKGIYRYVSKIEFLIIESIQRLFPVLFFNLIS